MVEKKSVPSLANTSLIIRFPWSVFVFGLDQCVWVRAFAGGLANFGLRHSEYHVVKYIALLRAANAITRLGQIDSPGIQSTATLPSIINSVANVQAPVMM